MAAVNISRCCLLLLGLISVSVFAQTMSPSSPSFSSGTTPTTTTPSAGPAEQDSPVLWTHRAVLDREGKVVLFWTPGFQDIVFELQVQAKGWVGLGFSPDGKMPNSDMVVGWVTNNEPTLQDRFAMGHTEPELDAKQDYTLSRGYENDTHTVFRFHRLYDTCDPKDTKITNNTMRVIYAYTDEDPIGSLLPAHRFQGSRSLILTGMNNLVQGVSTNTKTYEMKLPNITLSKTDKNLCWQKVFKYIPLSSKETVVGFEPLWRNSTSSAVDHVWLYRCDGQVDPMLWDLYSSDRGSVCDSVDAISQYGNCSKVFATAAAGSLGYSLPGKIGYSLNQGIEGPSYFLLRVAYSDWKANDVDMEDDTGIALIFSSDPLPFPAATLTVGHELSLSHIVPLDQKAFTTYGHCDAECTKKGIPTDGIHVYEVFLDSRATGRKMTLRHFRSGTELEPIAKDEMYESKSQTFRTILTPINILPGDNLILECVYDTTHAQSTLVGGIQPDSEACRAYLNYYPRMDMQTCTSSPPLTQIFNFLGTKQIGFEPSIMTYKETSPVHADPKLTEFLKYFNWVTRAVEYQNLTKSTYTSVCNLGNSNFVISEPRNYPKIEHPFYDMGGCGGGAGGNHTDVFVNPTFPEFRPDGPQFRPDGDAPPTQDTNMGEHMFGDQSHGQHEHGNPTFPDFFGNNETSHETTGNASATTQKGNGATTISGSWTSVSCALAMFFAFLTSRQQ